MKNFYLKQKVFSFRDRYKVYNENQEVVYHCEGRFFSITQRIDMIETKTGTHLYQLKRKLLTLLPAYRLYEAGGNQIASIKKRFRLFGHKIDIKSDYGHMVLEGNFSGYQFDATMDGKTAFEVRKKWFSWGDTYEVTIHMEKHEALFLAMVIMIDNALHKSKKRSGGSH
ncbi:MAG: LURP-one-related family protein [Acholeplasmataceae bacterium]|nr:LURP-one-related family protein [Acholeplasmataceae bacterium]